MLAADVPIGEPPVGDQVDGLAPTSLAGPLDLEDRARLLHGDLSYDAVPVDLARLEQMASFSRGSFRFK